MDLRAISILLVMTVHMADKDWHFLNGGLGVMVFFVLSGYLITMLALREEKSRGRAGHGGFLRAAGLPHFSAVLPGAGGLHPADSGN